MHGGAAGDELETLAPIAPQCWSLTVQKCQYCLAGGADTLHYLMKVWSPLALLTPYFSRLMYEGGTGHERLMAACDAMRHGLAGAGPGHQLAAHLAAQRQLPRAGRVSFVACLPLEHGASRQHQLTPFKCVTHCRERGLPHRRALALSQCHSSPLTPPSRHAARPSPPGAPLACRTHEHHQQVRAEQSGDTVRAGEYKLSMRDHVTSCMCH